MNKQEIRNSFKSICDKTPYFVIRFSWSDEPKVNAIYTPHFDSRFGPECFDDNGKTFNTTGKNLAESLGIEGLVNVPIDQAKKIILESKQFYKN